MTYFIHGVQQLKIVLIFNFYRVTATQLITFVTLCSFNNITLKMAVIASKHIVENTVNKVYHKYWTAFCWLFIYYWRDYGTDGGWNVLKNY